MTESFGEFIIETTPVSKRQSKVTVYHQGATICWMECWGKRVERHIVPAHRNQFRDFLQQWKAANGNKFPFVY